MVDKMRFALKKDEMIVCDECKNEIKTAPPKKDDPYGRSSVGWVNAIDDPTEEILVVCDSCVEKTEMEIEDRIQGTEDEE